MNLKAPEDREVFERLLEKADVFVENFRPGTMEKLGYSWEMLHERYPTLIYAAISGFGQTGPEAKQAAYDMTVQALGGLMNLTGESGGSPTRVGTSVGDICAGMMAAFGVSAALYDHSNTRTGRKLDISMLDTQVAMLENALVAYQATGRVPGPIGSHHPSIAPFGAFKAKDGNFILAAGNEKLFRAAMGAIGGKAVIEDPRFATAIDRISNRSALIVGLRDY